VIVVNEARSAVSHTDAIVITRAALTDLLVAAGLAGRISGSYSA
jgi:hypothetical protein